MPCRPSSNQPDFGSHSGGGVAAVKSGIFTKSWRINIKIYLSYTWVQTASAAVDRNQRKPYLWGMEVHFTPEQEAQLSRIATHAGMDTEHFVKDAALRLVEEKNRFSAAVREGIAQADRGDLIDDDEVRLWLERQEQRP